MANGGFGNGRMEVGLEDADGRLAADEQNPQTLANLLFPIRRSSRRAALEKFRLEYEAEHGPTDLTMRYTSVFPWDQQEWMIANAPAEYFRGLPPFVQAFIRQEMELAARTGHLDTLPPDYIAIYAAISKRGDR